MRQARFVNAFSLVIMASMSMFGTAAGAQDHLHFERSFTIPDFCRTGETVVIDVRGVQNFMTSLPDPVQVLLNVRYEQMYTHQATGATATFRFATRLNSILVAENVDGTLVFQDTVRGLTGLLQGADGGVRRIDAGNMTILTTTDADLNIIGVEVTTAGPHPSGVSGPPTWIVFPRCSDLVPALNLD